MNPNPINTNYTLPKEILGKNEVQRSDHGPFYFFSSAMPVHRVDSQDSVPHVYPCFATICTDWAERLPEAQVPPGAAIQWEIERDQVNNRLRYGTCIKPADKIRETILDMYAEYGVLEINAFVHKSKEEVDLEVFNRLIYPVRVEPDQNLPELLEAIKERGGLAVRKQFLESGRRFFESTEFLDEFGQEKRRLYLQATDECLKSFYIASARLTQLLNEADAEIRLRTANAGGKPTYDPRDAYMQWLMARKPVGEGSDQKPLIVQFPEMPPNSGGITPEQLELILNRVTESALAAVVTRTAANNTVEVEPGVVEVGLGDSAKRSPGRPRKQD